MTASAEWEYSTYDLCIIGGGPAGIITALEYARLNPSKKVVLVEYGTRHQGRENALDNSIEINNTLNHHDPYECTNKGLGGTSATWGGRCVMYDEIDFIDRPILKGGCTWSPEILDDLKKHLQQSANYFECGKAIFDLTNIPDVDTAPIAWNFKENSTITDMAVERWSMPTRFGKRYVKEMEELSNLYLMAGYEARDFGRPDLHGKVSSLLVRSVTDPADCKQIKAADFVIAAGAQESTRILLRNTCLFERLGFIPNALGRYYQGHLSGKIASVQFRGEPRKTDYGFKRDADGTYLRRRFQFTTRFLAEHNLLNTAIWLDNPLYYNPAHRSGAMSFMYLAMLLPFLGKRLAPPAIAHSVTSGKKTAIRKHLANIFRSLPKSLTIPAVIFFKRYCLKRKLPGIFLYNPQNKYALHFHAEQIPVACNSMQLKEDGETLQINYTLTDADIDSVIQLHRELDTQLRSMNCGELEYWFEKDELAGAIRKLSKDGIHQSGTTRIANSPEQGVVDTSLLLWGTKNVYVCSSSVFPTSGQANPTFFLGAFAVRLAAHLSRDAVNTQRAAKKGASVSF